VVQLVDELGRLDAAQHQVAGLYLPRNLMTGSSWPSVRPAILHPLLIGEPPLRVAA
jgi:hypothetical protein